MAQSVLTTKSISLKTRDSPIPTLLGRASDRTRAWSYSKSTSHRATSKSNLNISGTFSPRKDMSSGSFGKNTRTSSGHETKEVNSTAQHFVDFTEAEEDLVFRMHRLVGSRWELVAGRIPGRTAEEVKMFWEKKHQEK